VSQQSTDGTTKPYGRQRLLKLASDIISSSKNHARSSSVAQWRVGNMSELARLFSIGAKSQQTQDLFHMFAIKPTEDIKVSDNNENKESHKYVDLWRIIMGMTNFIPTLSTEDKCRLAFDLYDEKKSGFLLLDEIEQLFLRTYLYPRRGEVVLQKAKVIMSSADAHLAGGIGFDELLQVTTKFPNLFFPSSAFGPLK
jgi:hypothetical protein